VEHDGPVLSDAARACGHRAFRQTLAGIVFSCFSAWISAHGVNDIVDAAETDSLNPRQRHFMFGSRGAREPARHLKWQIAVVQIPFVVAFYFLVGPRNFVVVRPASTGRRPLHAPGIAWKGRLRSTC